jgi:DNA polymerase-4
MNRGLSRDETFGKDLHRDADIERELLRLVTRAAADLRNDRLTTRTIAVKLRDFDFTTRSTQRTLPDPVVSDRVILHIAHELLANLRNARRVPARLVGVRLSGLAPAETAEQFTLVSGSGETNRDRGLASAIDQVRGKYGPKSIMPGGLTEKP